MRTFFDILRDFLVRGYSDFICKKSDHTPTVKEFLDYLLDKIEEVK